MLVHRRELLRRQYTARRIPLRPSARADQHQNASAAAPTRWSCLKQLYSGCVLTWLLNMRHAIPETRNQRVAFRCAVNVALSAKGMPVHALPMQVTQHGGRHKLAPNPSEDATSEDDDSDATSDADSEDVQVQYCLDLLFSDNNAAVRGPAASSLWHWQSFMACACQPHSLA